MSKQSPKQVRLELAASELDGWTVSIVVRTDRGNTRADTFLQGPDVEMTCSGWGDRDSQRPRLTPFGEDLAAAHVLATLSRRVVERATRAAANVSQPDHHS
jgi:hypothetical protein